MKSRTTIEDLRRQIKGSACEALNQHLFDGIQLFEEKKEAKNKYLNQKVIVDGIEFDSKKEANRYFKLKTFQLEGKIFNLKWQVPFELSVCTYIADFTYQLTSTRELIVEDVKSKATRKLPTYRLKNKLMKSELNIEIIEI